VRQFEWRTRGDALLGPSGGIGISICETTSYEFVRVQSEFVLLGGIAGLDEAYAVEGSLGLDLDFDADIASLVEANATLMNPSGFSHGASLDFFHNLTGAAAPVVGPTTLAFCRLMAKALVYRST
jgi:hypothetical protein